MSPPLSLDFYLSIIKTQRQTETKITFLFYFSFLFTYLENQQHLKKMVTVIIETCLKQFSVVDTKKYKFM